MSLPPVVVISLHDAHTRRADSAAQLKAMPGLDWQFLDATDGRGRRDYPACYDPKASSRIIGFPLTQGEVACFMSHQRAWQDCVDRGEPLVILEDDFQLQGHFVEALTLAIDTLPAWDIFRLQAIIEVPRTPLYTGRGLSVVRNQQDPLGSAGYIVQPHAARALLDASRMIHEPLDHYLEHSRFHGQRVVCVWPYAVTTQDVPSTINDRPAERVVRGWKKHRRSFFRLLFRGRLLLSKSGRRW